jgi:hypothetical protein
MRWLAILFFLTGCSPIPRIIDSDNHMSMECYEVNPDTTLSVHRCENYEVVCYRFSTGAWCKWLEEIHQVERQVDE